MSDTIEVCCNGATIKDLHQPLRLEYRPSSTRRNVRLGLPVFVQDLFHIPARTLDLLELAAYIFAADRHTKRGGKDAVEYHGWSRRFRIHMRVRDHAFWRRLNVQAALNTCLTFMTGHAEFSFDFSPGHHTPPTSLFDQEGIELALPGTQPLVALFSGGLDSLSGAVNALATSQATAILVSHCSQPGIKQVQRALAENLKVEFPGRVFPYRFECTLSGVRAAEETQRSRSFLYAAIGFAIAQAYKCSSLSVYENGVTSLNLGRREDLMNARASRTTHPTTITRLQQVLSLVSEAPFTIETPAFWMTKKEIVEQIVRLGYGKLIATSVSCSRTFQREGNSTQCGRCFQCLDRRLAVFAAHHETLDDVALYNVDIARQGLPDEESKTTTVDYVRQATRFAEVSSDAFQDEYLSELADALDSLPTTGSDVDRIARVWQLMRSHGHNVRKALLRIRELYDDPMRPLAAGSLPSLVSVREHLRPPVTRLADAIAQIVADAVPRMFRHVGPKDENDLNQKLAALIGSHVELLSEHPTVPFACAQVVPDHEPVGLRLVIEAKFIRQSTPPAKASEGIAADLTKYPKDLHILFVVYDPGCAIRDDKVFVRDIESKGRCSVRLVR